MKKAIIFDVDGTAVDSPSKKLPSDRLVKQIVRLSNKYYFSSATGRVWSFVKPVLQAMKLSDPAIISAGTQICNPKTGEILYQKNVEDSDLKEAISIFQEYPDWKLLFNDGTEDDYFNGGIYPKDFINNVPVYFLEQVFIPDGIAKEIYKKLTKITGIAAVMVVAQKPGTRDIHVINSLATKEHTIGELLKIIKVDKKDTIGIGDGYNDMHLFNAVNKKIAMGNAVPELKEKADLVIKPVSEDGMAEYLKNL